MRLFLAVELDAAVRAAAGQAGRAIRARIAAAGTADMRWIPDENLHITLWFFGSVGEDRVPALVSALEPRLDVPAFSIELGGCGAFPPSGPPRVIWIGVRRGGEALVALHAAVGVRLLPLGFEPEARPYSAHLTIARVRDPARGPAAPFRRVLADAPAEVGRSPVTGVTLFRSRLGSNGATHEPVLRVPLNG